MTDSVHLNARADRCSVPLLERGHRIVFYHGEESTVVGVFFARGHDGQRELCYILRLLQESRDGEFGGHGGPQPRVQPRDALPALVAPVLSGHVGGRVK